MADLDILHSVARQYRAALAMLRQAIDKCPESLWLAPEYLNRYWHIAYHSVFYTYFYLQPGEADFRAWTKHVPNSQYLSSRPGAQGRNTVHQIRSNRVPRNLLRRGRSQGSVDRSRGALRLLLVAVQQAGAAVLQYSPSATSHRTIGGSIANGHQCGRALGSSGLNDDGSA